MSELGPYAVYVLGAYAAAGLALGLVAIVTLRSNAKTRRTLEQLERKQ